MISDFQILGIEPTQDISLIKSAYRKKAKEIHPDINQANFDNHIHFIVLQKAYHRLLAGKPRLTTAAPAPAQTTAAKPASANPATTGYSAPVGVKDPAYAFYKAGIKEYRKLHPSVWNKKPKRILIALEEKDFQELREMQEIVRSLLKCLPQAYYYFSQVVNDYPESVWAFDSRAKLTYIEQQTIRYSKIIESFTTHATLAPRVNKL